MSSYSTISILITYIFLYFKCIAYLFFQQSAHFLIQLVIAFLIPLKLQFYQISSIIFLISRCPYKGLLQCYYITSSYYSFSTSLEITNNQLSSVVSPKDLSQFSLSIIKYILILSSAKSFLLLKVFIYLFSFSSVYRILNLYYFNTFNYYAYHGVNSFIIINCSRFLQSIKIISSK